MNLQSVPTGWGIRCRIPFHDLGNLKLPHWRIRLPEGYVRLGQDQNSGMLICTLEDKEGCMVTASTRPEAQVTSYRMGQAVAAAILRYNRQYAVGLRTTGRWGEDTH